MKRKINNTESSKSKSLEIHELRLLSINKASKILGIRYETVKKLVRSSKIKAVITVNNKIKIPYKNLFEFINENNSSSSLETGIISLEETQNKIDFLIKEHLE